MNDTALFAFEDDFVASLRCVPMAVRFKLDACGVKLSLRQWSRFSQAERRELLLAPCETAAALTRTSEPITTVPVRELTTTRAGASPGCTSRLWMAPIHATF